MPLDQAQAGGPAGFERGLAVVRSFPRAPAGSPPGLTTRRRARPNRSWSGPPGRECPRIPDRRDRARRRGGEFEALEHLRIITDSELRHAGAHPDVIRRIIALAGEGLGNRAVRRQTAPGWVSNTRSGTSRPFFAWLGEVRFATAEKHIHPDALAPGFLRRLVPGIQHHADFRSAARRPPVDMDRCGRWFFSSGRRRPRRIPGGSIRCAVLRMTRWSSARRELVVAVSRRSASGSATMTASSPKMIQARVHRSCFR